MPRYDVCLAWNWEYDADFVRFFEVACSFYHVSLLQVTPENLESVICDLKDRKIAFSAFFDRACEGDERFQPLVDWSRRHKAACINPQKQTLWSGDKATMHLEFISRGLYTPYTIILTSHSKQPNLRCPDLAPLGGSFAIKPACEGGGNGVVLEASTWEQVETARKEFPTEKYLLQAHVRTCQLEGRAAWFRVLFCNGAIYPFWWDQVTHVYTRVTAEEKARFRLRDLNEISARISQICRLQLFSTEIALTEEGQFLIVDYVNDPVDLRVQTKAVDGVPDAVVENIAMRLARFVKEGI